MNDVKTGNLTEDERDEFTAGWVAATWREAIHGDVATHASQGDTPYDRGWNAYIDQMGDE